MMLCVHWVVTPIIASQLMDGVLWAALVSFISSFAFWAVNLIAAEIEMPFGDDPNDSPVAAFAQSFTTSLKMLMDPRAQTPPDFDFSPNMRNLKVRGWHHNVASHLRDLEEKGTLSQNDPGCASDCLDVAAGGASVEGLSP